MSIASGSKPATMPHSSGLGALAHRLFPRTMARRRFYRTFQDELDHSGEYELTLLPQLARRDKISIDVGGNIGSYAFHLSHSSRRVIVFEPNPFYADRLRLLAMPGVSVEQVALSDQPGAADLRIPAVAEGVEDQGMGSLNDEAVPDALLSRSFAVPLRRLDDYDYRDVGFIKIDVEGHEEAALAGALKTIAREKPNLLIEMEERHNPGGVDRVRSLLESMGYAGAFYQDGVSRPISDFDLTQHQLVTEEVSHIGKSRRQLKLYINNFVFTPCA